VPALCRVVGHAGGDVALAVGRIGGRIVDVTLRLVASGDLQIGIVVVLRLPVLNRFARRFARLAGSTVAGVDLRPALLLPPMPDPHDAASLRGTSSPDCKAGP